MEKLAKGAGCSKLVPAEETGKRTVLNKLGGRARAVWRRLITALNENSQGVVNGAGVC